MLTRKAMKNRLACRGVWIGRIQKITFKYRKEQKKKKHTQLGKYTRGDTETIK